MKYLKTNFKRQPGVLHSKHAVLPSTRSKNSSRNMNRSSNGSTTYNGKQVTCVYSNICWNFKTDKLLLWSLLVSESLIY
jgi:hypothetical protein